MYYFPYTGKSAVVSRSSVESQQQAKAFISQLMGVGADGVDHSEREPTNAELIALAAKVCVFIFGAVFCGVCVTILNTW